MADIDALIANGVRPPQVEDMQTAMARGMTLGNLMQQRQLQQQQMQAGQIELQQHQMALDQARALNDAYKGALTVGPNGTADIDTAKLTNALGQAGHGSAIPGVLKGIQEYKKSSAELAETQGKVAAQEADAAGALGATVRQAKYDPNLFLTLAQHAVAMKHVDAQAVAPIVDRVSQAMQADPSGAAARALVQQVADGLIAGSPKQRELDSAALTAAARDLTAQTDASKLAIEKPGMEADAAQKQRMTLAARLGTAKTPDEYNAILGDAPFAIAKDFAGKTPGQALQLGMTAEQQVTAAQAAANAEETKRRDETNAAHQKVEERQGAARISLEQQRYNATLGAGLDANGQPLSTEAAKAAAMQDPAAVAIARYQAPPPGARTSALGMATMRKVLAINPAYDATTFPARVKTAQDFSASGASGKLLTSADLALSHLDAISQAGKALDTGNFPLVNQIAQQLGMQVGQSPKTTYDTIVSMVAPEISKAVIGGVGGESERKAMEDNFRSQAAGNQREGAVGGAVNLIKTRIEKQANSYEQQMGAPLPWKPSEQSQAVVQRYAPKAAAQPGQAQQYKVGDTVMYQGKPHKVTAINNGKLVLDGN